MPRSALITGITGQDGSYLAEFLLSKGYEVHGIIRRASTFNTHRIDHIYVDPHVPKARIHLHYGDLSDPGLMTEMMYNIRPHEVYHLGAQSHVRISFDMPEYTGDITALGTTRLLEAIRRSGIKTRFYQASSSEMFGSAPPPQSELTPFQPRSPYAVAKLYAYWIVVNYREAYKIHASNGILFNHESPRRGEVFVTRKITRAIADMAAGRGGKLYLGNLDAQRDWGFAPEYVQMMWLMLQQDSPDDFVVGTGESHSVREFLDCAFSYLGVDLEWIGQGLKEKARVAGIGKKSENMFKVGDVVVEIDPKYFRPTEVDGLRADIRKAKRKLGWKPAVFFDDLVKIMIDHDMIRAGLNPPGKGIKTLQAKNFGWTNHSMTIQERIKEGVG
ncbi:MAG TPA: GDP-mannose 4,6-dehydratase [Bacteroidota bacterium]|nr:GDP-mannose 4,6-dehydratase [Bacteroidota bacterium]